MICSKCSSDNPADKKFCGDCGAPLEAMVSIRVPGDDGAYYCQRHKKEITRVRCGRCEKPVCVRCTVHGPAGPRCRECSRHRIPVRPMGILHEAGRGLSSPGATRTVWYLAIWYFIISIFTGFGGNRDA